MRLQGDATVEGIEIILPDALSGSRNQDFWQNLVDDIESLIPFEETTRVISTLDQQNYTLLCVIILVNQSGPCDM